MPSRFDRRWLSLKRATASIPLLAAASCAEPPTTASVAIPPLPPQQARIWFYREVDTADWNSTTPYVRLNGAIAGVPVQGGAFYRDVPPGHYGITVDGWGMSPTPSRNRRPTSIQQLDRASLASFPLQLLVARRIVVAGQSVEILQAPQRPGLPGDLIEVVRQSSDHMHEPKVGKICSKA